MMSSMQQVCTQMPASYCARHCQVITIRAGTLGGGEGVRQVRVTSHSCWATTKPRRLKTRMLSVDQLYNFCAIPLAALQQSRYAVIARYGPANHCAAPGTHTVAQMLGGGCEGRRPVVVKLDQAGAEVVDDLCHEHCTAAERRSLCCRSLSVGVQGPI